MPPGANPDPELRFHHLHCRHYYRTLAAVVAVVVGPWNQSDRTQPCDPTTAAAAVGAEPWYMKIQMNSTGESESEIEPTWSGWP